MEALKKPDGTKLETAVYQHPGTTHGQYHPLPLFLSLLLSTGNTELAFCGWARLRGEARFPGPREGDRVPEGA